MTRRLVVAPDRLTGGAVLTLTADESHYLRRVLRLSAGDAFEIRDGQGGAWPATLRDKIRVRLGPRLQLRRPSGAAVHLAVAPPRGKRMDLLLEKATELGVAELWPVYTTRSVRRDADPKRWPRMIRAAVAQCGAGFAPVLHPPRSLSELVESPPPVDAQLVADPRSDVSLGARLGALNEPRAILALIGPEGGFDPSEDELLAAWTPFGLGDTILRAETAAIAVLTIVRHRLSNLG